MKIAWTSLRPRSANDVLVALLVAVLLVLATIAAVGPGRFHVQNLVRAEPYLHVDAQIPVAVSAHVRATALPDTNWANADLPDYFKYDQFNFSSYNLAFSVFDAISPLRSDRDLSLFSLICFLGAVAVFGTFSLHRFGVAPAIATVAGILATPLLVQDSFYGRPEAFLTLLTAGTIALTGLKNRVAGIGGCLLAGLGLACKISFLPFALAAIASPIFLQRSGSLRFVLWGSLACVTGFALGVPGALLDPGAFIKGIRYLSDQYTNFFAPHGSADAGLLNQLGHASAYYAATFGLIILSLAAASVVALCTAAARGRGQVEGPRIDLHLLMFVAAALATVAYFSIQRTFFERNVSHAMAVLWLPVAWGTAAVLRDSAATGLAMAARCLLAAALAVGILSMTRLSSTIANVIVDKPSEPAVAASLEIERRVGEQFKGFPQELAFAYQGREAGPLLCKILGEATGDLTVKLVTHRPAKVGPPVLDPRVVMVAASPGPFETIPVSTLHTYHAARLEFYLLRPGLAERPLVDGCP